MGVQVQYLCARATLAAEGSAKNEREGSRLQNLTRISVKTFHNCLWAPTTPSKTSCGTHTNDPVYIVVLPNGRGKTKHNAIDKNGSPPSHATVEPPVLGTRCMSCSRQRWAGSVPGIPELRGGTFGSKGGKQNPTHVKVPDKINPWRCPPRMPYAPYSPTLSR